MVFDCSRFLLSSHIIQSVRITRDGLPLIHQVTGPFIPQPTHEDADTTLVDIEEFIENKENLDPTATNKDSKAKKL